jgi:hypothetical protein
MKPHASNDWRKRRSTDALLRLGGLAALAIAGAAIRLLMRSAGVTPHAGAHAGPTAIAALLAAIGFLAATLGSAVLVLGRHVFDRIEVSERWMRTAPLDGRAQDAARRSR